MGGLRWSSEPLVVLLKLDLVVPRSSARYERRRRSGQRRRWPARGSRGPRETTGFASQEGPGWQAVQEIPSGPISLLPQTSQNVEWSLKVHWLPASHGFSRHRSMADAVNHTALGESPAGSSMVVLVMLTRSADVTDSDAPLGASFALKTLSRTKTDIGPVVDTAPPLAELTSNSRLDHIAIPSGQQPALL